MRTLIFPHVVRPGDPPEAFPSVSRALEDPDGLLAVGGDLSPRRLLAAYRQGIFPWYSDGQPILWWSPDPRAVLYPSDIRVSRSLRKVIRQRRFQVRTDTAFEQVVQACAAPRPRQQGTWITADMAAAYATLHRYGAAHSVETWRSGALVGGLYGVVLGAVFFGESMFSLEPDASKVALVALASMGFRLIDCQVPSEHLTRLGAVNIPRTRFVEHLRTWCDVAGPDFNPAVELQ
jgi:leucyl/phenylalanyl-tRNA--protein transferase